MYAKSFIALIAASAVSAAPAFHIARDDLRPWQITYLNTHSPSGRPGNDPHSTLNFTIADPNTPTSASCSLQYLTASDVPFGIEQPCTTHDSTKDQSTWTFKIIKSEGASPYVTENFSLTIQVSIMNFLFSLASQSNPRQLVNQLPGQNATETFVGGDHFEVGDNMSGQCGGSGVCNWSLDDTPYEVKQTKA